MIGFDLPERVQETKPMDDKKTPKEKLKEAVEMNKRSLADWPNSMRKAASLAPLFEVREPETRTADKK